MTEITLIIVTLAGATFAVRLFGVTAGQRLPRRGVLASALNALPGCLIVSLVSVMLLGGGPREWLAGLIALAVAIVARNLALTMVVGILAIWLLRQIV